MPIVMLIRKEQPTLMRQHPLRAGQDALIIILTDAHGTLCTVFQLENGIVGMEDLFIPGLDPAAVPQVERILLLHVDHFGM